MEQYIAYVGLVQGDKFDSKFSTSFEASTREEAQGLAMEALRGNGDQHGANAVRLEVVGSDYTWEYHA